MSKCTCTRFPHITKWLKDAEYIWLEIIGHLCLHSVVPISRRTPTWITKPEPSLKSLWSRRSGILQTRNFPWKTKSQASNTMCERNCWAIIHNVASEEGFDFGNWHKSTQVCTNGLTRASLYMQSQARTTSRPVGSKELGDPRPMRIGIEEIKLVSQSKVTTLMLFDDEDVEPWAACFPPRFRLVIGGLGWTAFSSILSFKVLNRYSWSVARYVWILGDSARPTTPEIPHPSSRTVEPECIVVVLKRILSSEAIQLANKGVIFQTTSGGHPKLSLWNTSRWKKPTRACCAFVTIGG